MKVKVLQEFESARGTIKVGQIIEISAALLVKLQGKVEPLPVNTPNAGKNLPHYCLTGDCWCSEKLPRNNYPIGCKRISCEHYRPSQDVAQATNNQQGILLAAPS